MKVTLENQVVLVTGATGGLGPTVVQTLSAAGAVVIGTGRTDTKNTIKADLESEADVERLLESVVQQNGKIDGLVHLVGGIYPWSELADVSADVWRKTLDLNLSAAFLCCREAAKYMRNQKSGTVITVGSQAGLKGGSHGGPYGAAKAAVINLTQTLADEGKGYGFRANCIVPSTIDTPANRAAMPDADFSKWVTPQQLADTICFLLSPNGSGINGAILPVPGKV